jgi:hypothetical protein
MPSPKTKKSIYFEDIPVSDKRINRLEVHLQETVNLLVDTRIELKNLTEEVMALKAEYKRPLSM